jgi:hypothetical protein
MHITRQVWKSCTVQYLSNPYNACYAIPKYSIAQKDEFRKSVTVMSQMSGQFDALSNLIAR